MVIDAIIGAIPILTIFLNEKSRPRENKRNITPMSAHSCMFSFATTDMMYGMCGETRNPATIYPSTIGCFSFLNIRVTIPATINNVGKDVFAGCTALREIHFDKNLPQNVDRTAFNSPYAKKCYLKKDKDDIFIGLYTGCCSYEYLYYICNNFFL